jgi:hypothetical protein
MALLHKTKNSRPYKKGRELTRVATLIEKSKKPFSTHNHNGF